MEQISKLEIYPEKKKIFGAELKKLKEENISQRNKDLITEFRNYIFSTGSKELRVSKLSSQLRAICRWFKFILDIGEDLDKLNKKDVTTLVAFINGVHEKSEATKADYRRAIKQFYKWFKEEDSRIYTKNERERIEVERFYKYVEKEIKTSYKRKQADPLTIITDEDIDIVLEKGCKTAKEKAFVSLLHSTGARAGEFLNLRVGNLEVKENHANIHLPDGKTGKRIVPIARALPHLLRYLDVHPFRNNKDKHLWVSDARHNLNDPLLHDGSQKLINRCFKRAGVEKKHNMHWFRHSRASILAPKLTESMLCKYMGWILGSRQIRCYCHLCNKQLEDVFLSINGIKEKEDKTEKPIKCICGTMNYPKERYCFKCCRPLSVDVVIQDKELINSEMNKTITLLTEIAKNPELMKKFEEFKSKSS